MWQQSIKASHTLFSLSKENWCRPILLTTSERSVEAIPLRLNGPRRGRFHFGYSSGIYMKKLKDYSYQWTKLS